MKHINIPVFIPHLGCPHTCSFCNQRKISGVKNFEIEKVKEQIDTVLGKIEESGEECQTEIAFFGGSFTAIPRGEMLELLELTKPYLDDGRVLSLRCSTRPDCIDEEILSVLKGYGLTTVELGIQSMADGVLRACGRGHTAAQSAEACRLIKESGMMLVGQMMTGLPESLRSDEEYTAMRLCMARVDAVRIYPTMVFAGTELEKQYLRGDYTPPTEEDTIERVADLLEFFEANRVPVIRVGLCATDGLDGDDGIVAGSYEPAIGEMARGRVFLRRIMSKLLPELEACDREHGIKLRIICPDGAASAVSGHRRVNREYLCKTCGVTGVTIMESPALSGFDLKVEILK